MLKTLLLASALLLAIGAKAQGPGSGGPTPAAPTAIPLDGGASLLLAGGLAYGLRRLRQRRKK
ncbi:MprA protease, GlyGly-CTERM protein-sorting domain-containing form [Hymenobacter sp. UYCo722]|uniref:MprA protease, GlyGly-CTERM protein-sorting domain-containing form n=1 Tax=Hymenobacter sp. UYCo722 TaxID=3156335 RepID=UPI0033968AE0